MTRTRIEQSPFWLKAAALSATLMGAAQAQVGRPGELGRKTRPAPFLVAGSRARKRSRSRQPLGATSAETRTEGLVESTIKGAEVGASQASSGGSRSRAGGPANRGTTELRRAADARADRDPPAPRAA